MAVYVFFFALCVADWGAQGLSIHRERGSELRPASSIITACLLVRPWLSCCLVSDPEIGCGSPSPSLGGNQYFCVSDHLSRAPYPAFSPGIPCVEEPAEATGGQPLCAATDSPQSAPVTLRVFSMAVRHKKVSEIRRLIPTATVRSS